MCGGVDLGRVSEKCQNLSDYHVVIITIIIIIVSEAHSSMEFPGKSASEGKILKTFGDLNNEKIISQEK